MIAIPAPEPQSSQLGTLNPLSPPPLLSSAAIDQSLSALDKLGIEEVPSWERREPHVWSNHSYRATCVPASSRPYFSLRSAKIGHQGTRRFVLSHRFPDVVLESSRTRNRRPGVDEPAGRWRPLSGLVLSARRLELVKIVGRGLRLGGGGDDRALVVLQDGEPTCQVGGGVIARIMSHAEIGAKE